MQEIAKIRYTMKMMTIVIHRMVSNWSQAYLILKLSEKAYLILKRSCDHERK